MRLICHFFAFSVLFVVEYVLHLELLVAEAAEVAEVAGESHSFWHPIEMVVSRRDALTFDAPPTPGVP